MRVPLHSSPISRLLILGVVWLCATGQARAGGGGEDAGTVQTFLDSICSAVGQAPCPQLPTASQGILEIAALFNARPEAVRAGQNVSGSAVYAGNVLAQSPVSQASLLPLAFNGARTSRGDAIPTQLYDPAATSFFYAVTTPGTVEGFSQPQTLNLFYDYLLRTVPIFVRGQTVAKISLPLVVLNSSGGEHFVCGPAGCPASEAMLQIKAICTGGPVCLAGNVSGDFAGLGTQQSYKASDIGITFSVTYGSSPISKLPHATFAVQVPLVVTGVNDPAYFAFNDIANTTLFTADQIGHVAPVLGAGNSVGIPPYAAPPCVGATCPSTTPPPPSTFGFCASFSNNFTGPIGNPAPAVGAFVTLGTDGETLASAPLPSTAPAQPRCPF